MSPPLAELVGGTPTLDLLAAVLIFLGSVLAFTAALGILSCPREHRPDTLTRMHAPAKHQARRHT